MSGKFSEAVKSYKSYTDLVGKKTSREMGVPAFMQQCLDKKGQIAVAEIKEPAKPDTIKPEITKPEPAPVIAGTGADYFSVTNWY